MLPLIFRLAEYCFLLPAAQLRFCSEEILRHWLASLRSAHFAILRDEIHRVLAQAVSEWQTAWNLTRRL